MREVFFLGGTMPTSRFQQNSSIRLHPNQVRSFSAKVGLVANPNHDIGHHGGGTVLFGFFCSGYLFFDSGLRILTSEQGIHFTQGLGRIGQS